MNPAGAEAFARGLHGFFDELGVTVTERFEIREDVDVDDVRPERAHRKVCFLILAARFPGGKRFAVVFRFGKQI